MKKGIFVLFISLILFSVSKIEAQYNNSGELRYMPKGKQFHLTETMQDNSIGNSLQSSGESLNTTLIGRWANGPCYSVAVDSARQLAVFGNGGYLEIADISDPANPVEIGKVVLPSAAAEIKISGNYVYVADGNDGLRIIDINAPSLPAEAGFYDTQGSAQSVFISGSYAYLADGSDGLRIIDVSNPTSPVEAGFYDTDGYSRGIYISGDYAYVADGFEGLLILDISNISSPIQVGLFDSVDYAFGVYVNGNYAYVADWQDGLLILDISTPSSPTEVTLFDTGSYADEVYVRDNYAYVAERGDGLRIIDISNPSSPMEAGFYNTNGFAFGIYVNGNYAYVADEGEGLRIIDISDFQNIYEIGSFDTWGYAWGIVVKNNIAYVCDGLDGVLALDISNPADPREIGTYDSRGYAYKINVIDDYAFLIDGLEGLTILDIRDSTNLVEVGNFKTGYFTNDVEIINDYAYLVDDEGLSILDVSDKSNPIQIGYFDTPGNAQGISVNGNYAFVAVYRDGLRVIDISDPSNPFETGYFPSELAWSIKIQGGLAYLTDLTEGLKIIDISDPSNLIERGNFNTNDYAYRLFISGNLAYIADDSDGLRIININNPYNPTEVGYYDTGGRAFDVFVSGKNVYVADWNNGISIIRNEMNELYVNLGEFEANPGDTLYIPVNVSNLEGAGVLSYQFTIAFDSTVVRSLGIETAGTLSDSPNWNVMENNNFPGKITVGAYGSDSLTGEGVLIYLKFLAERAGSVSLLRIEQFLFNEGNPFANIADGKITVNCNEITGPIPYNDDFEDGSFCNWSFYGYSTGLYGDVIEPYLQNGRVFIQTRDQQSTWFVNGLDSWRDYSLELDAKIEQSLDDGYRGINCYWYMNNITEVSNGITFDSYYLNFKGRDNTWRFMRTYADGTPAEVLASGYTPINVGVDYHIKILAFKNSFRIYFSYLTGDEQLLASVPRSVNDLNSGLIGFGGGDDIISIDNINVYELNKVNVTLPDASGFPGDTVTIPVVVDSLDGKNILSYQFDLYYDSSLVSPLGIETTNTLTDAESWSAMVNTDFMNKIRVGAYGSTPLSGEGNLLFLKFLINGRMQDTTNLFFSDFLFNNGTPLADVNYGKIIINEITIDVKLSSLSGDVNDTLLVPITVSDLNNLGILSYQFGLSFDSTVVRVIGIDTTGTLTGKAGWTSMINANKQSSVKIGAFGANEMTWGDSVLIKLIVLLGSDDGAESPIIFTDFIFNNGYPVAKRYAGFIHINEIYVDIAIPSENILVFGDTTSIPINISDVTGMGILAYQFSLHYNPEMISVVDIETVNTLSGTGDWNVMYNNNVSGELKIGAYGSQPLTGSGILLYVKFTALGEIGDSSRIDFYDGILNNGRPRFRGFGGNILISQPLNQVQSIFLNSGWNMISSYIIPDDSNLDLLMQDIIENLIIMKNGLGRVFIPQYSINTIGDWNFYDGYKIYCKSGDTLNVSGEKIIPKNKPLTLNEGWNMFAYFLDFEKDVDVALGGISENLVIVKDINGRVFIPQYQINTLGKMLPGSGYKGYMSVADTLIYSSSPNQPKVVSYDARRCVTTHYPNINLRTGKNMILLVRSKEVKDNSEIIAVTENGVLVGSGSFVNGLAVLTVWGADNEHNPSLGANPMEKIYFKLWDPVSGSEKEISNFTSENLLKGGVERGLTFEQDALYLVELSNIIPERFELKQNYPNPFNPTTTIKYSLPEKAHIRLIVYDMLGKEIASLIDKELEAGNYSVVFDASGLSSGVYYYRIESEKFNSVKKMIILK